MKSLRLPTIAARIYFCLILAVAAFSARAEFALDIRPVAPGTGELRFTLETGYYYRLENSGSLTGNFAPASSWMLGLGDERIWTIHYPTSPAAGGGGVITPGDSFAIYPFDNGTTLVTWTDASEPLFRALVAADYWGLPPLVNVPENGTAPAVLLLVGSLEWNAAYAAFAPALLPAAQQAVLARLPTPAVVMNAATSGGTAGPGVVLDTERHFFRIRRMETDADGDGLDWAQETFLFHTDPNEADSDHDGISDGDEIALGLKPGSGDSDNDGVKDGSDAYPMDGRRSEDIPVKFYGVIDLSSHLSRSLGETVGYMKMAIDEANQVAFAHTTDSEMRTVVWKDGQTLSDTSTALSGLVPLPFPDLADRAYFQITGVGANGLAAGGVLTDIEPTVVPWPDNSDWSGGWVRDIFRFAPDTGLVKEPVVVSNPAYPSPEWSDPLPGWVSLVGPSGAVFETKEEKLGSGAYRSTPVWNGVEFSTYAGPPGTSGFAGVAAGQGNTLLWQKAVELFDWEVLIYDPVTQTQQVIVVPPYPYGINDQKW